jgi:hypothetical protein
VQHVFIDKLDETAATVAVCMLLQHKAAEIGNVAAFDLPTAVALLSSLPLGSSACPASLFCILSCVPLLQLSGLLFCVQLFLLEIGERVFTRGASDQLRWYEPPPLNTFMTAVAAGNFCSGGAEGQETGNGRIIASEVR